jgi:catechol 2,3-dioxygenase-like lactoylglutathione lyase family enzyme
VAELQGLHHAALTVSDREVSARWYVRVLGMVVLFREDGEHRRSAVLSFAGGAYSVGLVEHLPGDPASFDARHRGLDHLAFTVETRDAMVEWARRLDHHHVAHSGVLDVDTGAILNFQDPDGIPLALFWDRI